MAFWHKTRHQVNSLIEQAIALLHRIPASTVNTTTWILAIGFSEFCGRAGTTVANNLSSRQPVPNALPAPQERHGLRAAQSQIEPSTGDEITREFISLKGRHQDLSTRFNSLHQNYQNLKNQLQDNNKLRQDLEALQERASRFEGLELEKEMLLQANENWQSQYDQLQQKYEELKNKNS